MRVFRKLQTSRIRVDGEGDFDQDGVVFAANGVNNVTMVKDGDEIFDEDWTTIQREDSSPAGLTQAEVLTYLDEQKEAVRVAGVWGNSDTTTNLNTGTVFTNQLVPIVSNELKASDLFTRIDDNVVQVEFFGELCISVNLHLFSAGQRAALQSRIIRNPLVTPVAVGPICSTGYIRNLNDHQETSLNFSYVTGVSIGDQFAVGIRRETNVVTDVTMVSANSSQIQLMRLR